MLDWLVGQGQGVGCREMWGAMAILSRVGPRRIRQTMTRGSRTSRDAPCLDGGTRQRRPLSTRMRSSNQPAKLTQCKKTRVSGNSSGSRQKPRNINLAGTQQWRGTGAPLSARSIVMEEE